MDAEGEQKQMKSTVDGTILDVHNWELELNCWNFVI
jgi:hypothetical protein